MDATTTSRTLSDAEHSVQLRKAVIASTIGTTIEWYDFFLYGTAAGLIFGKLYFPNEDALTATLAGVRHLFHRLCRPADRRGDLRPLRRSHRPQGDADRDPPVHGHRDVPHCIRADLCLDRNWGAVILTILRMVQGIGVGGEWGGSVLLAMEWSRHHGQRGLVASWPQFGVPCGLFLANLAVLAFSTWSGDQFDTWGWRIPFAISIILVGIGLWIRLGILETPVFQQLLETNKIERAPIIEVIAKQPKEIILSALVRTSEQAPFYIFTAFIFAYAVGTLHMSRDFILAAVMAAAVRILRHHPAVGAHLRPHRPAEDVCDRRGDDRPVRLSLFRHGRYGDPVGGVHRDRAVAHPP